MSMNRRALLRFFASSAMTLPFAGLLARSSEAGVPTQTAKRFVVFYFPDGVPEPGPGGGKWHPSGSDTSFTLGENLQPLAPFASRCAFCHGADGQGTMAAPPVWGANSYSIGSEMARVPVAASFIKSNMPRTRGWALSDQDAYDVAAYINSQPRPDFAGRGSDWPKGDKPADAP